MKTKFTKRDFINIGILSFLFIILILFIKQKGFVLGSTTDWSSQHIAFPDYFRTLFYDTKDILPDFAFNIGAGQNIYNFAYYGLLNPVIMLSFLFPNINMVTYLIISTCILLYVSMILMYKFLRNNDFSENISLVSSAIFICATPLIFHMHRHIMFINYMPFLLLALMGVDKYFYEKKSFLLIISIALIIFMSFYYSIVSIICVVIYGIYRYIKINEKITFKLFLKDGLKFALRIIIGILISCILIVPTFMVILSSRGETITSITLMDLIVPKITLDYILYNSYGIGLTSISIFALVNHFFKKRENKFLAITLILILIFPIFNYILNATMYIDSKALIPMLPLYTLVIAFFIKDIINNKVNSKIVLPISIIILLIGGLQYGKLAFLLLADASLFILFLYIYKLSQKKMILGIFLIIFACVSTIVTSSFDKYVKEDFLYGDEYKKQSEVIKSITDSDNKIYRISNQITPLENTNRIYNNINYLSTNLYSSTYNLGYNNFYYDTMNNPIQSRNRVITSSAKNYPFLLLTANKYIVSNNITFIGYEKYLSNDGVTVYKNDAALPLAYATSKVMGKEEFESIGYPYNNEAILKNIIVDKYPVTNFESSIKKVNLDIDTTPLDELDIKKESGVTIVNIKEKTKLKFKLNTPLEGKILYIHFNLLESNPCSVGDSLITINKITNKLTCNPWKYHNKNYDFDYTIAEDEINSLNVTIDKGVYKIKNLEFYTLDYDEIKSLNDFVDEMNFDKNLTKGDVIEGDINVTNDGYFNISIPFDKGFKILVDGKEINYEKTNISFIGFNISKGMHHIKIEYSSPGKTLGGYISIAGIILAISLIIYEKVRLKNERRNIKK